MGGVCISVCHGRMCLNALNAPTSVHWCVIPTAAVQGDEVELMSPPAPPPVLGGRGSKCDSGSNLYLGPFLKKEIIMVYLFCCFLNA